ncbi:hypothetical protein SARC_07267 [Sphaeroforma arctica JP610]|uniref:Uncharacterized protein n=1 Tax=Sphaeroforma arctica JP610 TaxID=667725 RepID=A0A0L0FU60_9EUKA|nr:hypothetical protein SARC_07267 [Sphaeroforma arctica JP610]KNC80367.1 hypothetical protein SARC_07267 [Sphaeroforma arctica JP610]|eukprot:XP_014154269.1 hypothetical protein SARC_07267 [Sphaeroforma arctica JP610]
MIKLVIEAEPQQHAAREPITTSIQVAQPTAEQSQAQQQNPLMVADPKTLSKEEKEKQLQLLLEDEAASKDPKIVLAEANENTLERLKMPSY